MSKRNCTNIIISMLARKHVMEDVLGNYHLSKVLTNRPDAITDSVRAVYQHVFDVDASADETTEDHVAALLDALLEVNQQLMILFEGVKYDYASISNNATITYDTYKPFKADMDTYTQVTFMVSDVFKAVFQYPVSNRILEELGLVDLLKQMKEKDEQSKENDIQ